MIRIQDTIGESNCNVHLEICSMFPDKVENRGVTVFVDDLSSCGDSNLRGRTSRNVVDTISVSCICASVARPQKEDRPIVKQHL